MDQDTVVTPLDPGAAARAARSRSRCCSSASSIGLVVSIFQAVTQIQEQTLSFIPKILAIAGVLVIGGPWMLNQLLTYTTDLWRRSRSWSGTWAWGSTPQALLDQFGKQPSPLLPRARAVSPLFVLAPLF